MHNDAKRPAGPHRDGRLDVEVALDEALAGAIGGGLGRLLQRLDEVAFSGAEGIRSQVLALLKARRALTGKVERYASAYIHRADGGIAGARTVTPTTPLFLDDLAVSYLEHTGTLEPLTRIMGAVSVSKGTVEEVEALLAHEALAEKVLARVEDLRAALEGGIRRGNVVINERAPSGDEEADEFRRSPTIALLQSVTPYDAILVDDKALNRMANWDLGRARTATTLDMLDVLQKRQMLVPADAEEALRVLRVANFQVIGTTEEELLAMMASREAVAGRARTGGRMNSAQVRRHKRPPRQTTPANRQRSTLRDAVWTMRSLPRFTKPLSRTPCGRRMYISKQTPQFMHTYVNKMFGAIPHLFFVAPMSSGNRYSQLCMTYMLAFVLGMLARYFPTHWVSLSQGDKGDSLWPTLNQAHRVVAESFPELVAEMIEDILAHPL